MRWARYSGGAVTYVNTRIPVHAPTETRRVGDQVLELDLAHRFLISQKVRSHGNRSFVRVIRSPLPATTPDARGSMEAILDRWSCLIDRCAPNVGYIGLPWPQVAVGVAVWPAGDPANFDEDVEWLVRVWRHALVTSACATSSRPKVICSGARSAMRPDVWMRSDHDIAAGGDRA